MDAEQRRQVASQVRAAREAQRYTQKQIADRAGVSLRSITDLETGRRLPQDGTLSKIMDALGMARPEENRQQWPNEVQVFLDVLGAWLTGRPESDRMDIIRDLTRRIMSDSW